MKFLHRLYNVLLWFYLFVCLFFSPVSSEESSEKKMKLDGGNNAAGTSGANNRTNGSKDLAMASAASGSATNDISAAAGMQQTAQGYPYAHWGSYQVSSCILCWKWIFPFFSLSSILFHYESVYFNF